MNGDENRKRNTKEATDRKGKKIGKTRRKTVVRLHKGERLRYCRGELT